MRLPVQGWLMLALFLPPAGTFSAEATHDAARLEQVVAAHQGHTTVQGRLRWLTSQRDDPGAPVREEHVRFYLRFPDHYALVLTKPQDQDYKLSFISDGVTRTEVTQLFDGQAPDVKKTAVGTGDEVDRLVLTCFRFDLVAMQKDFAVTATAAADHRTIITLTPLAAKLKEQLTVLVLTFSADQKLTAIRSEDPQGNRFDFTVLEAIYDQPLDDALFRVGP
jgi:hypothetical protein